MLCLKALSKVTSPVPQRKRTLWIEEKLETGAKPKRSGERSKVIFTREESPE